MTSTRKIGVGSVGPATVSEGFGTCAGNSAPVRRHVTITDRVIRSSTCKPISTHKSICVSHIYRACSQNAGYAEKFTGSGCSSTEAADLGNVATSGNVSMVVCRNLLILGLLGGSTRCMILCNNTSAQGSNGNIVTPVELPPTGAEWNESHGSRPSGLNR